MIKGGKIAPLSRYEYLDGATVVYDAENHKTIYRYDENKRVTALEIYQKMNGEHLLYRIDRYLWDDASGNLKKKIIEDGKGNLLLQTEYEYDKNQNLILEKSGDGKEFRQIVRHFSEDGLNLKIRESDGIQTKIFSYYPQTNLLASELTCQNDQILMRQFYFYDDCAVCTRMIVDDGKTLDPDQLEDVTYRHITDIKPKASLPCFGLPEWVEQKSIDSQAKEFSLGKVHYFYTPFGKVAKEDHYDAKGTFCYSLENTYDLEECLVNDTDALGHITRYTYDANHNVTSIEGPKEGEYKEITYDLANRPILVRTWQSDGTTLSTQKVFDCLGQVVEEIDYCKNRTRYEYDALGRQTATFYSDGGIEKKEYDPLGNLICEKDVQGYETHKKYNAFGQLLQVSYPDGSSESFIYCQNGQLESHLTKEGAKEVYIHDIFGHVTQVETFALSGKRLKSKQYTWSPFAKLSERESDLDIYYEYDLAGRLISEKRGYEEIFYGYDPLGRRCSTQTDQTRQVQELDYADNLVHEKTEVKKVVQKERRYSYDAAGNRTHVKTFRGTFETVYNYEKKPEVRIDPFGNTTHYFTQYEKEKGITSREIRPNGTELIAFYDSCGREKKRCRKNSQGEIVQLCEMLYHFHDKPYQLNSCIYSESNVIGSMTHRWEYGPMQRLERFIEAEDKQTRYCYDLSGRVQKIIKPDGKIIYQEHDELGRLTHYFSSDFDYTYEYDERDRLIKCCDRLKKTETYRSYDPLNHLLEERLSNGFAIQNLYDLQGRRIGCKLPDNSWIIYSYEGCFLNRVERKNLKTIYSKRNLEGEIVETITPVGKIKVERDQLGRVLSIHSPHFSSTDFNYDSVGNLLYFCSNGREINEERVFEYDALDQLVKERGHEYQFDSLGNRLQKDQRTHKVNELGQIESDGECTYEYDLCGNLISDGKRVYKYDALDRLIAVVEGDRKTEYEYDPLHRRILKKQLQKGKKELIIRYLWDGQHEIGSGEQEGLLSELRILGEGIGAEIGSGLFYEIKGRAYVPIHDHRGSVVCLVEVQGANVVGRYHYSAFGQEQIEGELSPWRFCSKRVDEESGLIFFGRRYYSPKLGRWCSQDPQGFVDGLNLYTYLGNNPLAQVDLYGLWSFGESVSSFSYWTFRGIEWFGGNLMPISFLRNWVEGVGRWGLGEGFLSESRYRTGKSEVIRVEGKKVPNHSYTHANGMLTRKEDAILQAKYISQKHGGIEVDMLYQGTQGLVMDLINCGLSKLGIPTSYNLMCARYYKSKLRQDRGHLFTSCVHSRGGIQMMTTGRLLTEPERKQIDVISYGSATLIPKDFFRNAHNYVNRLDVVTMTNPVAFLFGALSDREYNVHFLTPMTRCPFKAHGLLEPTYAEEIAVQGSKFIDKHLR